MDASRCFSLLNAGDASGLQRLLDEDPAAANARDAAGVSLLMQALYRGRRDIAAIVAARKGQLDLFEAASLGMIERLRQCLTGSSSVNGFSPDGFTALHFACFFGQPEAARILLQHGAAVDAVAANPMRVMPLHSAASARNTEAARLLLEHGAPVNARQHGGWAPIHAAAQNGDRATMELLLRHDADAQAANDEGKTPVMLARERGHAELIQLLANPRH